MECLGTEEFEIVLLAEKLSGRHYTLSPNIKLINLNIQPQKGLLFKLANIIRHMAGMRRHIIREAPDVIISFTAHANCYVLLSFLLPMKKRPRLIVTEHSEEMFLKNDRRNRRYIFLKGAFLFLMHLLYHRADYIVAVSKGIERHLRKLLFVSPYRLRLIYNPIDMRKAAACYSQNDMPTAFKKREPCIGTISRLSPEKGTAFLIDAFKALLEKTEGRLLIVGDGPERLHLEEKARRLGLSEKIVFTGWVDEPFRYLAQMDVFVLPSLWEGFPNAILESMACGVPVVASDSSEGVREAIKDGVNGVLVRPGSSDEIASAVYDLLSNAERRRSIIKEAYNRLRHYDIDEIRAQYEALL
jgi:glycosyltransferase involved in cell wall biosynthesis